MGRQIMQSKTKFIEIWIKYQFFPVSKCIWKYRLHDDIIKNGNIFRVTGHLCGEFTGHRWIPRTKASDAELWCFLWSASE